MEWVIVLILIIGFAWVIYNQFVIVENQVGIVKLLRENIEVDKKLKVSIDDVNGRGGV